MARLFTPPNTSREEGGSLLLDRLLDLIARAFGQLDNALTFDALKTQAIATTDTKVYHGLGFRPRGYIVCGLSADARVWTGADDGQQSKWLNLRASAPVTATLLFF